jgi:hypothetical protein
VNADPFELVKRLMPGLMIYGRAKEKAEDDWTIIFLIREEEKYIKRLKYNPVLQVRMGLYDVNGVMPVVLMLKAGEDMLYDGWLNYHSPDGEENIRCLMRQERLIFQFYDRYECRRTLAAENSIKEIMHDQVEEIKKCRPWSMKAFDRAKERLYEIYPTGQALWENMSK